MYAIIETGGKQYRVQEGDRVRVEKIDAEVGKRVQFNRVLYVNRENEILIGAPLLDNASVQAEIVDQDRAKKIIVFKKKRRKGFAKKQGHRQDYTEVKIEKIVL